MRSLLLACSLSLPFLLVRAEFSIDDASLFRINFRAFSEEDIRQEGELGAASDPALPQHSPDLDPDPGPGRDEDAVAAAAAAVEAGEGGDEAADGKEEEEAQGRQKEEGETEEEEPTTTVTMISSNREKYTCTLPRPRRALSSAEEAYAGPNVLQILQKLFISQACAYRLEHYWTYELCHGRYIRQFHEDRDGKEVKTTEYYLGKYDSQTFEKDMAELKKQIAEGTIKKPQKKRIETMNMPFYELVMTDGTVCDLNGRPRITRVNYVCYPAGKHEIYSFKESSTCEYDIIILSPTLCAHPDYRPEESNELDIDCRPADDATPQKPLNLARLEEESLRLRTANRMYEGEFMQGDGPGSVRIEIKPVHPGTGEVDPEGGHGDPEDDEALEGAADRHKEENWPSRGGADARREPLRPLMDPEVVKEFLMGEYCLYGGTGWWKYEFCYGKKVDQYHEERGGKRTVINLGAFNEEEHLKWLQANPGKRPKRHNVRKHISHFYSGGDVCDLTGKPRNVEVKLKCKKSDSPSAVSLYLLEPKACEYILGVESPLVCDLLDRADDVTGLVEFDRDIFEHEEGQEEKVEREEQTIKSMLQEEGINPPPPKPVEPPPLEDDHLRQHQQQHQQHLEEHAKRAAEAAAEALVSATQKEFEAQEAEVGREEVLEQAAQLKERIASLIRKEGRKRMEEMAKEEEEDEEQEERYDEGIDYQDE